MSEVSTRTRRLLIGAGNLADAVAALRLAEQLTEALEADLGGLLIEETVIAEALGLPGQRVVTFAGAVVAAPAKNEARALFERDAMAFRDALSRLARARKRNWFFERREGDLVGALFDAAQGRDLLLLGHRPIHRYAGRPVLIAPQEPASRASAELSGFLVRALPGDPVALALRSGSLPPDLQNLDCRSSSSTSELLFRISRMSASAVVLDLSAGPFRSHDDLRLVLAAARCPVLVLGADEAGRT